MEKLIFLLFAAQSLTCAMAADTVNDTELQTNSSDPNKDMYVIHAMVYQVGILTNKTDNETTNLNTTMGIMLPRNRRGKIRQAVAQRKTFASTESGQGTPKCIARNGRGGNQEAVTFYHTNGSQGLDLSKISSPLLTNVTAQSMVGVAPMPSNTESGPNQLPWSTLSHIANMPQHVSAGSEPMKSSKRMIRSIDIIDSNSDSPFENFYRSLFKRDVSGDKTAVSIHRGSAVIPQAARVQSLAIPPLLTLNNNLSNIPVPIPNTSVVHYSKINTLVTQP